MKNKEKLLISFSGGRTSAMMTKYLLDNHGDRYDFVVVFANTGHERQATLDFVDRCDREFGFNTVWVEGVTGAKGTRAKVVDYNSAYCNYKKNGVDPFETMIAKYGISNLKNPHCSREMKKTTIRAYMRDFLKHKKVDYKIALGIRSDEPKRLNWESAKKNNFVYFAEFGNVTKYDVNEFWAKQSFDLDIKSYEGNCILCWKKSDRKLFTLIREGVIAGDKELIAEIEWLREMENKYGRYIPQARIKQDKGKNAYFFYDNRSIDDLIEESEFLDINEFSKDESKLILDAKQMSLWDNGLDMNSGCVESCEVF